MVIKIAHWETKLKLNRKFILQLETVEYIKAFTMRDEISNIKSLPATEGESI